MINKLSYFNILFVYLFLSIYYLFDFKIFKAVVQFINVYATKWWILTLEEFLKTL